MWWLLVGMLGCSYERADYREARDAALCSLHVDCFGTFTSVEACEASQLRHVELPCRAFSALEARACVRLLKEQASSCPTTDLASWQPPATCADACVYPAWDTF